VLKARSGDDLIFGLSARNVDLLMQGKPISIDLRDLGLDKGRVMLFYGTTEESMKEELQRAGVVMPATQG
jgi:hypothetical protein